MIRFKYVFKELLFYFLMAFGVLSAISLMQNLYKFIPFMQATGIEVDILLQMVLFSIPTIASATMPIGLMIGIYMGTHSLSMTHEIIAMRASGVSLSFLFKPTLTLSCLVALLTALQSLYLSPLGVGALEDLKFNMLKKQTKIQIGVGQVTQIGTKTIYIFDRKGDELKGIFIAESENPDKGPLIEAQTGNLEFDQDTQEIVFHLRNGKMHFKEKDNKYRLIRFRQFDYKQQIQTQKRNDLPQRFRKADGKRTYRSEYEISSAQLIEIINSLPKNKKSYREYRTELHSRIVVPLACIGLALFALPIGVINPRSPRSGSLFKMLVMIIFYYTSFIQATVNTDRGHAPIFVLYLPFIITFLVSVMYFYKANYDFDSLREMLKFKMTKKD